MHGSLPLSMQQQSNSTADQRKGDRPHAECLWYCQVGHGHQSLIAAITNQLNTLTSYNTFDPFTNDVAVAAAEAVAAVSPHPDGRVFWIRGGRYGSQAGPAGATTAWQDR